MYRCRACGRPYLSQFEADLCSPREDWPKRYPHRFIEEYASAFGKVEK